MPAPFRRHKSRTAGQLDAGDIANAIQFIRQAGQRIAAGELAEIRQHIEDPVIPHHILTMVY
jgi:hypothetical protein